jgi:hypothetical protein
MSKSNEVFIDLLFSYMQVRTPNASRFADIEQRRRRPSLRMKEADSEDGVDYPEAKT